MDVHPTALSDAPRDAAAKRTFRLVVCVSVLVLLALIAVLLWWLTATMPLAAFAIAFALAIAWCMWLERHPEQQSDGDVPQPNSHRG